MARRKTARRKVEKERAARAKDGSGGKKKSKGKKGREPDAVAADD